LDAFFITNIPVEVITPNIWPGAEQNVQRLEDVVDYLEQQESAIRSRGLPMRFFLTDGEEAVSTEELRDMAKSSRLVWESTKKVSRLETP
jgi:hypothetical protein